MTLRENLGFALQSIARPVPVPLPAIPRCVDACVQATARLADGGEPGDSKHLEALVARFREACRRGTVDGFSAKEWRDVVWGIWLGPEPLADVAIFFDALVERLRVGSRSLCRKLILSYLTAFDATKESIVRIGGVLRSAVTAHDWEWAARQQRFSLFEADRAPAALAAFILGATTPIPTRLAEAGISGSRRFGGMEAAAFKHALRRLRTGLEAQAAGTMVLLDRVLDWAVAEGRLAFPQLLRELAETLLLPWQALTPTEALQERILAFLLHHLKDPRIEPGKWQGVSDDALRVIRRWLTRAALEQFLQVVDKVAEAGHWRFRRAFWLAYYEKRAIEEAWVVFAPTAEAIAGWGLRELAGYGRLNSPRLSNHCVLLMRLVGDVVVAEISHVGKCRLWLAGNREAPPFYRKVYQRQDIERAPDFEVTHQGSPQLAWQRRIAGELERHTGIRIPEHKFRPV